MAIVKNFWLKNQKKKLAGMVLYKAMGQTRSRELASEVSNPRTTDQMSQRVRWANLVNFYRANKSWMKFAFETKPTNRTDYNQFMSLNAGSSRIYLPKSLASQGACIVDAYQMTQGSLPSIETVKSDNGWQTNLFLPTDFAITSTTTVAEFANALIAQNPAIREGDQLSFIRITQQTNATTGVPFVVVRKYEVILKTDNLRFLGQYLPLDYINAESISGGVAVVVDDSGNAGGFLLILSRTIGGKTYVSSQSIVVANNSGLITQFSSSAALQEAIDSYGESTEPFLTSTSAETDTQAPVGASVLSVNLNGTIRTPGSTFYPTKLEPDDTIDVTMSDAIVGSATNVMLEFVSSGQVLSTQLQYVETVDNTLSFEYGGQETFEGIAISDLTFKVNGTAYRAPFLVPNEAFQSGLE